MDAITACAAIATPVSVRTPMPILSDTLSAPNPKTVSNLRLAIGSSKGPIVSQKFGSEQPIQPCPAWIGQEVCWLNLSLEQLLKV